MRKPLRKPEEFLRVDKYGQRQRKCLSCEQWLPENENHYFRMLDKKRQPTFSGKCRPCKRKTRKNYESRDVLLFRHRPPELPPTPPDISTMRALMALNGLVGDSAGD